MASCGIPTVTCILLLLVLGALYATAMVQVSSLPGITRDVKPRDPKGSTIVWRRRIYRHPEASKRVHIPRGRLGGIADSSRSPRVLTPIRPGSRRGNERPIVDNECGPDGCSRRRGGGRRGGRRKKPSSPFSRRQLKLAEKLTNATAIFADDLLISTMGRGRLRDSCVSPFSVHMALTMMTLGAKGSTQRQINHNAGLTATRLRRAKAHRAYHTMLTSLSLIHPNVRLLSANAVFVKRGIPLELAFRQNLEQLYQAKFSYYPLAPIVEIPVNDWVSMATQNTIPKMLPVGTIDNKTEMIIINALSLSASWQKPFDVSLTRPHVFETLKHEFKQVQMMEISSTFRYKEDKTMKIIEIPYQSGDSPRLAMYIILPDLSSSLKQLMDVLTGKNHTNPRGDSSMDVLFQNLKSESIKLRLPKFKVEPAVSDLSKTLRRMGIRKAFNARKANFTGISMNRQLRIDKFLHKTVVKIDENGSYVKLSTPAPMNNATNDSVTPTMELVVDRPFMFVIRDIQSRLTLINGVYTGDDLARRRT